MPDPTHETWLPVPGYEGLYEVSDLGRVRSLDRVLNNGNHWTGRILKAYLSHPRGYRQVSLYRDGVLDKRQTYRLVLEAFTGPCPDGMEARHLDGDPGNNALSNLCWGTDAENVQDMMRHGTHWQVRKTHCKRGHEFTPENTYRSGGRPVPGRGCRECRKLRKKLRRSQSIGDTPRVGGYPRSSASSRRDQP